MTISRFLRLAITLISIVNFFPLTIMAESTPDFAFPTKVIAQSERNLTAALKKHDNQGVVTSLVSDCIAENLIDNSKAGHLVQKIDSVIALSSDPTLKAMLNMLNARLLTEVYLNKRYVFDQRNLPDTPLPDDIFLWSGKQMRDRIMNYINESMVDTAALATCPLSRYQAAISMDNDYSVLYPTLFDFIAYRAINSIYSISGSFILYDNRYLLPGKEFVAVKNKPVSEYAAAILDIYARLIEIHCNDKPAYIAADISRLQFVRNHLFYVDGNGSEYYTSLRLLYDENRHNEYSALALVPLADEVNSSRLTDKEWVRILDEYISRFPDGKLTDTVRQLRATATCKSVSIGFPATVPPATPVDITVTFNNVHSASISIYNVTGIPENDRRKAYKSLVPIAILPVGSTGEIPFSVKKKVPFSFPGYGVYMIVPSFDGSECDWPQTVTVTSLAAFIRSVGIHNSALVLDRMTGNGVSGVSVNEITYDRNGKSIRLLGTTDGKGILDFDTVTDYGSRSIAFSKGADSASGTLRIYSYRDYEGADLSASIFTSLPLYHPGDSLDWAAVIFESSPKGPKAVAGKEVEIALSDANRQPVGSLKAVTDDYGRIEGNFVIPKDRLTGYYFMELKEKNRRFCSRNIMVSDYVAPELRITTETPENDAPNKGDVTIRGKVATYSGFNLAGIPVRISLSSVPPFYYRAITGSSDNEFLSTTVDTDADGNFSLVLSRDLLDSAPLPDGMFIAQISATSSSGETVSASISFMRSAQYRIKASLKSSVVEAPSTLDVKVSVLDYKDDSVKSPVVYSIAADSDTIVKKSPLPADGKIAVDSLPSGKYQIIIATADETLSTPVGMEFIIYRLTDSGTPVKDVMLWSPDGQLISLDKSRKLNWRFAVNESVTLHYCVATDSAIIENGTFTGRKGFNCWDYTMPSRYEKCAISIVAYKNNECYETRLTLSAPPAVAPIKIKAESFRDRILPGKSETWKFSVIDDNNTPREAAVMLRMYNAALEALQSDRWELPHFSQGIGLKVNYGRNYNSYISTEMNCGRSIRYRDFTGSMSFNTWGYSLYSGAPVMLRMSKAAYMSAAPDELNVVREHKDEVIVEDAMDLSADAGNGVVAGYGVVGGIAETTAETETENDGGDVFQYRDAEVAGAFFRPMLVTDPEGHLAVTFTVPDANTTWRVNALAFTKTLDSSVFNASVISSKPLMVSPQVPAFVRLGDCVDVKAMVMNKADSTAITVTAIEFFNPADDSVIASAVSTDTVGGHSSATVSCAFKVDLNGNAVGYRVKSSTGDFADGEAGLIPVLPSVTPVIESTPFYLSPGRDHIEIPLSESGRNPIVTLQYTENPAWYVAAALPGLINSESSTAIQAASSIYSASIAAGLMRDNPVIETGLRQWLESNRNDSTYLSLLDRNPDLKIMLLEATPWMLDAKSDAERMTRLALLFDKAEIDRVTEANITCLTNLVNNDGGFKWMSQSTISSDWATSCVLKLMGQLNNLGYLPDNSDLAEMIENALSYLDRNVEKQLERYNDGSFRSYTFIVSLFPTHTVPDKCKPAIDMTLTRMSSNWKKESVSSKASSALILNRFGKAAEAREIIESIFDFAVTSPESGMWWPSIGQSGYLWRENTVASTAGILEAVDAIMPGSENIEKIRQWIILQKQATDWRDPVSTSTVISAVLKSSAELLKPAGNVNITVGETEIVPSSVEKVTGYVRADLTPYIGSGLPVRISRDKGGNASWGSVINRYEADMNDVAGASIEGLSISKSILRYDGSKVESVSELTVGDKVSVQLTIISDRDIDYVAIDDQRGACFLPAEQLPRPVSSQGIFFYLEQRRDRTRVFVDRLPRGKYIISYDLYVTNSGTYTTGIATLQSQYAPELTAHSSSKTLTVNAD